MSHFRQRTGKHGIVGFKFEFPPLNLINEFTCLLVRGCWTLRIPSNLSTRGRMWPPPSWNFRNWIFTLDPLTFLSIETQATPLDAGSVLDVGDTPPTNGWRWQHHQGKQLLKRSCLVTWVSLDTWQSQLAPWERERGHNYVFILWAGKASGNRFTS